MLNTPDAMAQSQPSDPPSGDAVLSSIQRGVGFLLKDQNADGSWGGARGGIYTFTGDVWSNPATHKSWRVATTGLACVALLHSSEIEAAQQAIRRGVDYLIMNFDVGRPNEWDTMDCWAYIYALQAFAETMREKDLIAADVQARIRELSPRLMLRLRQSQSLSGGWGYLEFDAPRTAQPQWATSFTTAAGVVALVEAKRSGLAIDEDVLLRARRAVERCHMPSGAYTYSVQAINDPRSSEWIDQIKGSLSRIQSCNVAILLAGGEMPVERLRTGIRQFFEYHRFLDIARNRPIPHETYYLNSGYFYLFGHYYAARVIAAMPEGERADLWSRLQREIMKTQQRDGSLWDYDMHAYHKPYGTAYGLLGLAMSVEAGR
ncbi:MAG: hypothetical protein ACKVS9_10690 [Phycisphaerae bacterium]